MLLANQHNTHDTMTLYADWSESKMRNISSVRYVNSLRKQTDGHTYLQGVGDGQGRKGRAGKGRT